MKVGIGMLLAVGAVNLTACVSPGLSVATSDLPAHSLSMGKESYLVRQLTESTWTVNSADSLKILNSTPEATAKLRQAVEKTSGCAVTDSDFSSQGRQFDAQVTCSGTLAR